MLIISHRGNINGSNEENENKPSYILDTIKKGYDVEIDVWMINNKFYLGHDKSQYEIDENFLFNEHLWCHSKNLNAMEYFSYNLNIKSFWHQNDDRVFTSNGYIWTYPGKELCVKSIAVLPEKVYIWNIENCYGICTDYCDKYRDYFNLHKNA